MAFDPFEVVKFALCANALSLPKNLMGEAGEAILNTCAKVADDPNAPAHARENARQYFALVDAARQFHAAADAMIKTPCQCDRCQAERATQGKTQ